MKTFCATLFILTFAFCGLGALALDFGLPMTQFRKDALILFGAICFIAAIGYIHCETSEQ